MVTRLLEKKKAYYEKLNGGKADDDGDERKKKKEEEIRKYKLIQKVSVNESWSVGGGLIVPD